MPAGIIASLEATEFIDEQQYEIKIDTHGIMDGPKLGRLRILNKVTSFSRFIINNKLIKSISSHLDTTCYLCKTCNCFSGVVAVRATFKSFCV